MCILCLLNVYLFIFFSGINIYINVFVIIVVGYIVNCLFVIVFLDGCFLVNNDVCFFCGGGFEICLFFLDCLLVF